MIKFIFSIIFLKFLLGLSVLNSFIYNFLFIVRFFYLLLFKFDRDCGFSGFSVSYLGLDKSSYILVLLTFWVLSLMLLTLGRGESWKILIFLFILVILLVFFSSLNLILMYLFFELRLIPTYFIIVYWGISPERVAASFYLLVYILFISLPFLFYIMFLGLIHGRLRVVVLSWWDSFLVYGRWDYIVIVGAFLIKLPVYIFHLWLPKAHVEAPVYGSMVLAAVLLKLGAYGLYRILLIFKFYSFYHEFLMRVGLVGSLLVSLLRMVQIDMKGLVAYSSVVHINLILVALLTLTTSGSLRSFIIMVSHGLCSSGMFFMVNFYYERTSRRLLVLNKGIINYAPSIGLWWFLLCRSNFSYPLSLNFMGEITMLISILRWRVDLLGVLSLCCFFRGAYSLYLFSYIQHGSCSFLNIFIPASVKEYLVVRFHYFPLVLILFNLIAFY